MRICCSRILSIASLGACNVLYVYWVWMVVRFVCVIRVPVCARVSRVCPGSRLIFLCVSRLPPGVFLPVTI